jgi:hypothetical protein
VLYYNIIIMAIHLSVLCLFNNNIAVVYINSHYQPFHDLIQPPEAQTKPIAAPNPVYVDIGPSTASQEYSQMILVPPCDDKVEYAEVKQTVSTNSEPAAGKPVQ